MAFKVILILPYHKVSVKASLFISYNYLAKVPRSTILKIAESESKEKQDKGGV